MTSHSQRIGCQDWVAFDDPLDALQLWCVRDQVAADIAAKYTRDHILWQLVWLPYRVAKNPSGLLVRAIVGRFPRPGILAEEVAFAERQLNQGQFPLPSLEAIRASDASFEKWKELQALCEQAMRGPRAEIIPESEPVEDQSKEVCFNCINSNCKGCEGHDAVDPEITHAPGCDDPTCEGCDVF